MAECNDSTHRLVCTESKRFSFCILIHVLIRLCRALSTQEYAMLTMFPVWSLFSGQMDTLGFEPRAFRMRSRCDATTPCAPWTPLICCWQAPASSPNVNMHTPVSIYKCLHTCACLPKLSWPEREAVHLKVVSSNLPGCDLLGSLSAWPPMPQSMSRSCP